MRLARGVVAFVALAVAGIMWSASAAAANRQVASASDSTSSAAYQRALDLGIAAYIYGYPLLDTDRIFRTATSVNVPDGQGAGPVNQFSHVRRLADPSERTVVAPNHDTLYSLAWLDLQRGPIVIHMPVVHRRFAVMGLLDPTRTRSRMSVRSATRPGITPSSPLVGADACRQASGRCARPTRACGSSAAPTSRTRPTRRTWSEFKTGTR